MVAVLLLLLLLPMLLPLISHVWLCHRREAQEWKEVGTTTLKGQRWQEAGCKENLGALVTAAGTLLAAPQQIQKEKRDSLEMV